MSQNTKRKERLRVTTKDRWLKAREFGGIELNRTCIGLNRCESALYRLEIEENRPEPDLNRPKWTEPAEMDKNRPKRRGLSLFRPLVRSRATGDPRTTEIESHREPPRSRATEIERSESSESHREPLRPPRATARAPRATERDLTATESHREPPHTSSNPKLARNKKDYQEQQRTTQ